MAKTENQSNTKLSAKAYLASSLGGVISAYSYISTLKQYKKDMEFEAQKIFARQRRRAGKMDESSCQKELIHNPQMDNTKTSLANTLTVGMAGNFAMIAGLVIVSVVTGPLLPMIAILGTVGAAFAGVITGHFLSPKIAEKNINTEIKDIVANENNKTEAGLEKSIKTRAAEREALMKSFKYKETKEEKNLAKAAEKTPEIEKPRPEFLQKIFDEKSKENAVAKPQRGIV